MAGLTSPHRWVQLGLLGLIAVIAYIQRAAMSVPATEIAGDLQFSEPIRQMGWVQSAWYFAYAFGQLPSGWIVDRWGFRGPLAIAVVSWSVATMLAGAADGLTSLMFLWALMGLGQAAAFPAAAKAISQTFPDHERARASGLLAAGMMIGGAIAPVLAARLLHQFLPLEAGWQIDRWRLLLAVYAIPGLLWTALFLLVVRPLRPSIDPQQRHRTGVNWTRLLTSGSLALLCGQQFFRAAAMVFFLTWFPTFLQQARHVSALDSGWLTTVAGIGGVVGSLTGGTVSDWLLVRTGHARLSRQGIAVLGMTACGVLILLSLTASSVYVSIALIAAGVFCATFGGVSGYTVAIQFGGQHTGVVFSAMNMCGNIGAALFPLLAGELVTQTNNWNLVLVMFAGIMFLDAVCWAVLNPKGTLFHDDHPSP
jgi:MFS transporter, ACS family, D-galactonate transporter